MTNIVVIGAQWGDEGKGKIVDYLCNNRKYKIDIVCRFNGGGNAGHTIVIKDSKFPLHYIPSGVFSGKENIIGNGCVLDLEDLVKEIDVLKGCITEKNLFISDKAHLIMPWYKLKDMEVSKGKLGTTGKGIGPAYADKYSRCGIALGDLVKFVETNKITERVIDKDSFVRNLKEKLAISDNWMVKRDYVRGFGVQFDTLVEKFLVYGEKIKDHVINTEAYLHKAIHSGKHVLFEGAQGTLLDINFGTYPYVTSSSSTVGGVFTGTGLPPKIHGVNTIDRIIGVAKAYTTRVGEGPFPTEIFGGLGERIQNTGKEFGTTTGRIRRVGWLDIAGLRYAKDINGLTELIITKLDVLSGLDKINICYGYQYHNMPIFEWPNLNQHVLGEYKPLYTERPSWNKDISDIKKYEELPANGRNYLQYISKCVGLPITLVSVGPEREQTIECNILPE